MKKHSLILLFASISLVVFSQTGSVQGTITKDHKPIHFAGIYSRQKGKITSTDSSGHFALIGLTIGKHILRIHYENYGNAFVTVTINKDQTSDLYLNLPDGCWYSKNSKRCPYCKKKNQVKHILYGSLRFPPSKKQIAGGCIVYPCRPKWFCARDSIMY